MALLRATLLALVVVLAGSASAQAALLVEHQSTAVAEQVAGDGLIGPGDDISLAETLLSSETQLLTGLTGRLTSSAPGVTITHGGSGFPDVAFGATTTNSPAFTAAIAPGVECGQNLDFLLAVDADQGSVSVPITVGTGVAGAVRSSTSIDVPRAIPDGSSVSSSLQIAQPGRVKDLRVDIGQISHGYVGDLRIWIEAPDHTTVVLLDRQGGSGDNLVNTVFAISGANLGGASAPFTGTFRAEGGLDNLVSHSMQGTWTLHVADQQLGDSGTLVNWGLHLAGAACDGNPIPSFTATPNPATPGSTVNFDAAGSTDPNGTITRYEWDLDGNGSYETDTGTTATVSHLYPAQGSVDVGLRVTDDQANTATTVVPLAVTQPPVADVTWLPTVPSTGDLITLDGSGSTDPDGVVARYQWDLDGDGTFERDTGAVATTTVTFATAGAHTVRLRVTDDNGATNVKAVDVGVANRPPTARLTGPSPPVAGVASVFDASTSSDPEGAITRYEWDLDGDGSYETDTGPVSTASKTWPAPGARTVGLRVTDANGATATTSLALDVDAAPLPALAVGPNPATVGAPVLFSAQGSSDPDGTIARYEWDLDGDGSYETDTASTTGATHTYATAGTRTVGLRITDDRGAQAVVSVALSVVAAPAPADGSPGGTTDVTLGSGDPGSGTPATPGGGSTGPSLRPFTAGLLGAPIQALRLARKYGLTLVCRAAAVARCTLTANLPGSEAVRLGLARARRAGGRAPRNRVVGRVVATTRPGADVRIRLLLSKPLRHVLRRAHTARLLVRGTATDAAGRSVSLARVVLLRG